MEPKLVISATQALLLENYLEKAFDRPARYDQKEKTFIVDGEPIAVPRHLSVAWLLVWKDDLKGYVYEYVIGEKTAIAKMEDYHREAFHNLKENTDALCNCGGPLYEF